MRRQYERRTTTPKHVVQATQVGRNFRIYVPDYDLVALATARDEVHPGAVDMIEKAITKRKGEPRSERERTAYPIRILIHWFPAKNWFGQSISPGDLVAFVGRSGQNANVPRRLGVVLGIQPATGRYVMAPPARSSARSVQVRWFAGCNTEDELFVWPRSDTTTVSVHTLIAVSEHSLPGPVLEALDTFRDGLKQEARETQV